MKTARRLLVLFAILVAIKSINLLSLPLYLDEGIYIFWAKLVRESAGFAYVSMQDGKTPLFMWILSRAYPLFHQYLLTGRVLSVVSAGITFLSWAVILIRIWRPKTYLWFWVLIMVCPYTYLVERMAFVDSLLVAFASLSLLMFVLAREAILASRWKFVIASLFSGLFMALAFMTKPSATVFVAGQIAVSFCWAIEQGLSKQFKKALLVIVSLLLMLATYSEFVGYMRVGAYRFWDMIQMKESLLTFLPSRVFSSPDISLYRAHSVLLANYSLVYLGSLLIFVAIGLFYIIKNQPKLIWLVVYAGLIISAIFLSGKVTASRYFYMAVPTLLAIGAMGIEKLLNMKMINGKALTILALLIPIYYSSLMVAAPLKAKYAPDDQGYFVSGDISALGLTDAINYINKRSSSSVVGVTGIWGVAEGSMVTLSDANINNLKIDNLSEGQVNKIIGEPQKDKYLYLTRNKSNLEALAEQVNFNVERVYTRPYSNDSVYLLKIQ